MAIKYLENLVAERDSLATQVMALADKAGTEDRSLSDAENASVVKLRDRITALDTEIRSWSDTTDAFSKFAAIAEKGKETRSANTVERRSLGEQFINSPAFTEYRGGTGARFVADTEIRALVTTADLGLAPREWNAAAPALTAPLLAAIGRVATDRDVIKVIRVPAVPVAGGPIAEGSAKPEAALVWDSVNVECDTYAHWIPVTRQSLQDAPYMQSLVDGLMQFGVTRKLEQAAAAVINAETGFLTGSGADLTAAIRDGISAVEAAGFRAETVVMNPADAGALDIAASAGSLNYGDRRNGIWGVPIVTVPGVSAGTAFVGQFSSAVTMFDRRQVETLVTDSHEDLFIKNTLVLLSEARAGFAVTQPQAVAKVTGGAPFAVKAGK